MMQPTSPQAATQPAQGAGQSPGQPPIGSSPMTGPTQNLGSAAAGMARMGLIVQLMSETVPLVGATSEPGQALLEALRKLSKHVQPGSVTEQDKKNSLEGLMRRQQQMAPQLAALRAAGGGAGQQQQAGGGAAAA